jgi:hypothetical protein
MAYPRAASSFRPWLGLTLIAAACAGIARTGGPPLDACSLLTAADLARVQGGSLQATIPSGDAAGTVATTQCFYRLDRFASSVSLSVTRAGGSRAARRELRARWERLLHRQGDQRMEGERDRGQEESSSSWTPIAGLGEDAFLIGGRGSVSLYVLAPGAYLRVSVGGPGDPAEWSRKAQALARTALGRL